MQLSISVFTLLALSMIVGIIVPKNLVGEKISARLSIGFALIIIGSWFSVRYSIPQELHFISTPVWITILLITLNYLSRHLYPEASGKGLYKFYIPTDYKKEMEKITAPLFSLAVIFFISAVVFFIPELITKASILHHKSPDFDGHLLSAAYITQGGVREELLSIMGPTLNQWDFIPPKVDTWSYPDFVSAVAFEFLYRSTRVGHAGLISTLYSITNFQPAILLLSCMCFASALTATLIYEHLFKTKGMYLAVVGACILIFSQGLLIQRVEGVVAQLITLPLITACLIQLTLLKNSKALQLIGCGILICAISETFGEGALYLGLITVITLLFNSFFFVENKSNFKNAVISGLIIFIAFAICDPLNLIDLTKWTILRIRLGFPGGGDLHGDWYFLDVIYNLPHFRLDAPYKIRYDKHPQLGIALFILTLISIKIDKNFLQKNYLLIIVLFVISIPYFIGHQYAYWKCVIISLPFIIIIILSQKSRFILNNKINLLNFAGFIFLILSLWGYTALTTDYINFALRVQLPTKVYLKPHVKEYAIVTLQTEGFVYYKYGQDNKFYWLNSGWGPNFVAWHKEDLPVYGLIDCTNYREFCGPNNIGSSFYLNLNKKVSDYLNKENKIDLVKAIEDLKSVASQNIKDQIYENPK